MYKPYWHAYHTGGLIFWIDYDVRVEAIRINKPKHEQGARLHFMQPVKGVLPDKFVKASAEYAKARDECDKAWDEREKAWDECDKAWAERDKASDEYDKAWDECDKAWDEYVKARAECEKEINALHAKECPDCVWDGAEMQWANYKK